MLLQGLFVAIGPAVSPEGSFLVFSEYGNRRIIRYWLRGLQADTMEVLFTVPGLPNQIKRTSSGYFWVAVNVINPETTFVTPQGFRFNIFGQLIQKVDFINIWVRELVYSTSRMEFCVLARVWLWLISLEFTALSLT